MALRGASEHTSQGQTRPKPHFAKIPSKISQFYKIVLISRIVADISATALVLGNLQGNFEGKKNLLLKISKNQYEVTKVKFSEPERSITNKT